MQVQRISLIFFFAAILCLITIPFCSSPQQNDSALAFINHHDSVDYVGIDACAQCHLDKYETFVHTGMGQSFDDASKRKSAGTFDCQHIIYDTASGYYYLPFWSGENLFVKEFRLKNGDTVYQRIERIDYIIGSGQHTNSHLIRKGDYVVQAPFTWYAQKQKLDLPPGFENGNNSRFSRVIDLECMSCHNALPIMKSEPRAFENIPQGINCERCHGPGSAHVALRKLGITVEGEDKTIVNPSKLSWQRQIDVCQRCHLQGNNVLKPGKSFADFRPGMVLSDVFEIYLPHYEGGGTQFNMANHSDRLQSSKCFLGSNNTQSGQLTLTCITCHNPHVSVKTTNVQQFNLACQNCHKPAQDNFCSTPEVNRIKEANNCVKCHMPVSGTEDIPHVTVHDHKIGIYKSGLSQSKGGKVDGLYCVNNPHPTEQTLIRAYLTYFEKFDPLPIYQQKAEALLKAFPDPIGEIHLHYQRQDWAQIRAVQQSAKNVDFDAASCYRIGKAYHHLSDYKSAVSWLDLAVLKDDQYFEYKSELAVSLLRLKDFHRAKLAATNCLKQFPDYVPALNNLGFACLMLNELSEAKNALLKALQLDPRNINAMENLVLLYDLQNNKAEVRLWLMRILEIEPNHLQAKKRILTLLN